jgi:hypothetical protein
MLSMSPSSGCRCRKSRPRYQLPLAEENRSGMQALITEAHQTAKLDVVVGIDHAIDQILQASKVDVEHVVPLVAIWKDLEDVARYA